eukprot:m.231168 g.231168  ORF g.231168 m.231168 type:complete len:447 (+) comp15215_c5_seq1:217-1557(+)
MASSGEKHRSHMHVRRKRWHGEPIAQLLDPNAYFDAVLLCIWDDSLGPCIRFCAMKEQHQVNKDSRVVASLPKLTLNDVLAKGIAPEAIPHEVDTKYLRFPGSEVEVACFIFSANIDNTPKFASLCLLKQIASAGKNPASYIGVQDICHDRATTIILNLCKCLQSESTETAFEDMYVDLKHLLLVLKDMETAQTRRVLFRDTLFKPLIFYDVRFLNRCLTSHLETSGMSVVVGKDVNMINLYLNTLTLFLPVSKRGKCRPAQEGKREYCPDVVVQGLHFVDRTPSDLSELHQLMLESCHPSTVIDIDHKIVAAAPEERQYQFAQQQDTAERLFQEVRHGSPLVEKFLNSIVSPRDPSFRAALVDNFTRRLSRLGLIVIQFTIERNATPDAPLSHASKLELRRWLRLQDDHDFRVVLATVLQMDSQVYDSIVPDYQLSAEKLKEIVA